MQNLLVRAVELRGLDAETLRTTRPDLMYREARMVSVTGTPSGYAKVVVSVADVATGMYAHSGILTARYERERTGKGSTMRVAVLDVLGAWMMQPTCYLVCGNREARRTGAQRASLKAEFALSQEAIA